MIEQARIAELQTRCKAIEDRVKELERVLKAVLKVEVIRPAERWRDPRAGT
jgi:hypothetical protein